jgi:hypothetical protein
LSFCTVINCMDGRVQLPVLLYLKERFKVPYVDSVTEPGPIKWLSEDPIGAVSESIIRRVAVSTERHGSRAVAVVSHADCSGNPLGREAQLRQLESSMDLVGSSFPAVSVLGLWVDESWNVHEVELREPAGR